MHRACSQPWSAACTWAAKTPRYCPSTRAGQLRGVEDAGVRLNGIVFILMGLQLPLILSGIHDLSMGNWRGMGQRSRSWWWR
jgi:hypothetical protein